MEQFLTLFFLLKFSEVPGPPPFQNPAYATEFDPFRFNALKVQKLVPQFDGGPILVPQNFVKLHLCLIFTLLQQFMASFNG